MSLEIVEASIVAIGSFNPPIVSVDWLQKHELIGEGDATTARASEDFVVSRQITRFATDAVKVQVLENQLAFHSVGPVTPALRDIAMSVLQLLPHAPVSGLGINFMVHYKTQGPDVYHQVGDKLAPKGLWEEIFPKKAVGLVTLAIRVQDGVRNKPPESPNATNITIQPSTRVPNGVFLQANNHYGNDLDAKALATAGEAAKLVQGRWDEDYKKSLSIFASVMERTAGKESL